MVDVAELQARPRVLCLGGGYMLRFIDEPTAGRRIGAIVSMPWPMFSHEPHGQRCEGSIWFDVPGAPANVPKWDVVQVRPLTLEPSIQCRGGCNAHGFIRAGRWVDA